MKEPQEATDLRLWAWHFYKAHRHSMATVLPVSIHRASYWTIFILATLLIEFLVPWQFTQRPFVAAPYEFAIVNEPQLRSVRNVAFHPACGALCSVIADKIASVTHTRVRGAIAVADSRLSYEINPPGGLAYISPSNGERYFVTNYHGFTIDVSHFEVGMERGLEILKDLDAGRSLTAVRDQIRSIPGLGALGYTSEYVVYRLPTTREERERLAWGIYLHSQRLFERWQGSGWLSPGNEWWQGSSYANEDLPSDYLGFYAAARYPDLSAEDALKAIAQQLGGGSWTNEEPPHAGSLINGKTTAASGAATLPLHWGDLRLKNPTFTPRVVGEYGWYNVAWPASLSIDPIWQGAYWRYRRSFNTRNGQPWLW